MALNRVCIAGRLTADPEQRKTTGGDPVANFSIAVDRDYKDKDGNKLVDFLDVVTFKKTAEIVCKFFKKGSSAIVEGKLQARSWKDKDGNNRKTVEVVADHVYFGDSKKSENTAAPAGGYVEMVEGEEELPF